MFKENSEKFWNIVLYTENENKLEVPKNNPKKSGKYLCTCVRYWRGIEIERYLQIMEYDALRNTWHDCNNPCGISHTILAWTNDIILCDFQNFKYVDGFLVERL